MKHFLRLCQANRWEADDTSVRGARQRLVLPGCALLVGVGLVLSPGVRAFAQGSQISQMVDDSRLFLLHSRSQGYMGVFVGDVDPERVQTLHLKDAHGAEITVLDHDAPAAKQGLKLHDVVLQLNGVTIENADQMKRMLRDIPVGRKVQLVVNHEGALENVTVQMADRYKMQAEARQQLDSTGTAGGRGTTFLPGDSGMPSGGGFHLWMGSSMHVGALVEPLAPQTADFLGLTAGVMIKSVERKGAADTAGLRQHDVVLAIGGESVTTTSDWERLLRSSEGKPVQVEILRDRTKQLVLLQVRGKHQKD